MPRPRPSATYQRLPLDGVIYAVLPERDLLRICGLAEIPIAAAAPPADSPPESLDTRQLAERLTQRRRRAGLSQAELARRAGIRIETLNRIERGHTTPDFATIRKLVVAMQRIEQISSIAASKRSKT